MAILTRDLCNEYGNIPLSPLGIKICLSAVKVLVAALKGTDSEEEGVVESNDKRNVMTKVAGTGVAERGRGRESKENDNNRDKDESKGFGSEDSGQKGERDEEKGEEEGEGDEEGESDEEVVGRMKLGGAGKREEILNKNIGSTSQVKAISQPLIKPNKGTILKLEDLIPIFIPDRAGVLSSSLFLTVDDAPWISSTLSPRSSSVRFIHYSIDRLDAFLLGSKSLRGILFSGDDISCPKPKDLKALLLHDQINEVIRDFTSLSDTLQATSISILYDMRSHPTESLMHPGLAGAQGPSLIIYLEGPSLTSDAICQLLGPTETLPPNTQEEKKSTRGYGFSGGNFDFHNGLNSVSGMGIGVGVGGIGHDDTNLVEEERLYPVTGGKRLSTAFAITDCLQIMSGREYIIIDPCGLHLLSPDGQIDSGKKGSGGVGRKNQDDGVGKAGGGRADTDENSTININSISGHTDADPVVIAASRAQRCFLSGSHSTSVRSRDDEDVLTRFPDQFSPILSLPFNIDISLSTEGSLKGLLVRMVSIISGNFVFFYFYLARIILRLFSFVSSLSYVSSLLLSLYLFLSLHRHPFCHSVKVYCPRHILFFSILSFTQVIIQELRTSSSSKCIILTTSLH